MKPYFDGETLVLSRWRFAAKDARVPHRHYKLAQYQEGRNKFFVCRNHRAFRGLWWIHGVGDGFAGDGCSRITNTITTRNEALASKWIEAVNAGRVRLD